MPEEKAWQQNATLFSRHPVGLEDLNEGVIKRFIYLICESSDDHKIDSLHLPVSSLKCLVANRWLSCDLLNNFTRLLNRSSHDIHCDFERPRSFCKILASKA